MKNTIKKRILVISEEEKLVSKFRGELSRLKNFQVINEPYGEHAYRRIKEVQPDMMIVDLETPNLVTSWLAMQLEDGGAFDEIPAVMISEILDKEEREIISDMTGYPVLAKNTSVSCLENSMV